MYAFVGLGNPGSDYAGTRHNLGYEVIDELLAALQVTARPGKGSFWIGSARHAGEDLLLVKPSTFMNNSGEAVVDLIEQTALAPERLVVVCDDVQLPLGTLRLRRSGSDGGHNGLYSIIDHLQSLEFPRLRCGIGSGEVPAAKSDLARFVLGQFTPAERPVVSTMVRRAAEACLSVAERGIERTMTDCNAAPNT